MFIYSPGGASREAGTGIPKHLPVTEDLTTFAPDPARILTSPLALTPGTRLGPYEITARIGVGGMGEDGHDAEA